MDSQRNLLVIALLFVSFMIWQAWEQDKNPQPQAQQTTQTTTTAAGSAADQGVPASGQGKLISVKTDVLDLTINTRGGDVEQALLPAYPKELNSTQPFQLLETSPQFIYQAQSGLTGRDGLLQLTKGGDFQRFLASVLHVVVDVDSVITTFQDKRFGKRVTCRVGIRHAEDRRLLENDSGLS